MISAKEDNIIFLKLGENEDINSLQNALEAYEIKSGFLEGFGKLKFIETENEKFSGEVILFGLISDLKGKPHLELYCYSKQAGKVKNFISNELIVVVKKFNKIKLNSMIDEEGKLRLVIED
jgi:hypothetical protein